MISSAAQRRRPPMQHAGSIREHVLPRLLLHAWPFPRGAGRLVDLFFSHLSFASDVAVVRTTDGFSISVMPNELIGRHLYLTGEFDRSTVEVLLKFARSGDTLINIGANIGYVAACFLTKVANSTAIAIEPQPEIVELLYANLAQFRHRVQVVPAAISEQDGTGYLQIDRGNRGASRLVSRGDTCSVEVDLWSPRRLFSVLRPAKVDLLVIDVEGHEKSVLRGLEPFLAGYRPRLVIFESHGADASPDACIGEIFRRIGYSVFGVQKRLTRLRLAPIKSAADCRYNDYVAVPARAGA